ncbi:MAG: enoyl-ACP reductase [Planctomycetota bacterium]
MTLLEGRRALIVGIANDRSYAWHIAKALAEHGCKLAFTHLPGEKNERRTRKAAEKLPGGDGELWLHPLDAGSDDDIDAALEAYGKSIDRLDVLVHSIAFAEREWLAPGKFIETPRQAYTQAVDISAYTLLGLARAAVPIMERTSPDAGGSIMAMSYYGAEKVVPGYNVMGVAKASLEATARYLAGELGEKNIRVNTISGGYLRTLASSAVGGIDTMEAHNLQRSPLRRNVEGEDVGRTAVYLASELGSGVTGENIYVDCGVNTIGL